MGVDRRRSPGADTPPQEAVSDGPVSDESDIRSDSEISDGPCPCSSDSEEDVR